MEGVAGFVAPGSAMRVGSMFRFQLRLYNASHAELLDRTFAVRFQAFGRLPSVAVIVPTVVMGSISL